MDPDLLFLSLFAFAIAVYYFELIWIWMGLMKEGQNVEPDHHTPLTLIIAARDEEKNLKAHLELWLSQNHSSYEVLVVNDCSDDDSEYVLAEYQRKYPHLQVINLKESAVFKGGKKIALTLGIKGAQFDRLLFTDADCKPYSKDWLANMNAQFGGTKHLVLGMGLYEKRKGLLNFLIRMDAIQVAIQYLGLASRGIPFMGVGRNLAYTQSLFFEAQGFKSHQHIKWGDDDLFVNEVANKSNTAVCTDIAGSTVSIPKENYSEWFSQKRRHMSTSSHYSLKNKIWIGIKPFRIVFFNILVLWGLFFSDFKITVGISAGILYLSHALIFIVLKKRIGKVDSYLLFPLVELLLFGINVITYVSTWLRKPTKWI